MEHIAVSLRNFRREPSGQTVRLLPVRKPSAAAVV